MKTQKSHFNTWLTRWFCRNYCLWPVICYVSEYWNISVNNLWVTKDILILFWSINCLTKHLRRKNPRVIVFPQPRHANYWLTESQSWELPPRFYSGERSSHIAYSTQEAISSELNNNSSTDENRLLLMFKQIWLSKVSPVPFLSSGKLFISILLTWED